ncbi:hypothetical protein FRACYDRAFT_233556 [Fragilariopsis cylindrus CCMP1102]|uniref:EF-hand domain-containing protein n=1 Tax=Fragilariopsis cylindrus CCMP1102 TaxID=635003 RepID=A0A1E7FZ41_9STRA|nr:hypothetical protein FRACYDRAFT_233556 [Fragilariopsis cylindrus CCMP1102]|eukprot:OEU23384.1 hypothetical protein FRACYDRAFT_233556 [Fragilariopsis cylindrus CCMP1102]
MMNNYTSNDDDEISYASSNNKTDDEAAAVVVTVANNTNNTNDTKNAKNTNNPAPTYKPPIKKKVSYSSDVDGNTTQASSDFLSASDVEVSSLNNSYSSILRGWGGGGISNSKSKREKEMKKEAQRSNSKKKNKATYDNDVMLKDLNEWVGKTKQSCSSVTGVLLCSMIERVAIDGKFSEKEAESVMTSLKCQQSLFGYLIVMDCLFLSMFLPLLVEDTLLWQGDGEDYDGDNNNLDYHYDGISQTTFYVIKILYEINVSFVFFSCCVHVMICGLFLGLSSYLMDAKSVLWMLVHCHDNFVFINSAMFPIFIGVILTGMLGCILRLGTTSDGTWIANEEVDETLGRNTKKVLKKLAKSNDRNYSRTSMINVFDRIAAGNGNGNGGDDGGDGNNGEVDLDTLRNGIGKTSVMLTDYEMKALFMAVDKDGDGVITRDEWEIMVNKEIESNDDGKEL